MNILFVLSSFAHRAGVERVISDKMNYLAEHGHHVVFATYEQGNHPLIFPLHASVVHSDLGCPYFTLYHYPLFLRLLKARLMKRKFKKRLQSLIERESIDLLVTPTNAAMFMGEMMNAKRVRKIVESHGAFSNTMIADGIIKNVGRKLQLFAIRKCDLLISLTDGDAKCWKTYVRNVEVHPNPISLCCENLGSIERQEGRILTVGGLNKHKRFDRLIDAFALLADRYPKWYIDIFGDGDDKEDLEKRIKGVGLVNRIRINPSTPEIASEYQRSQFLVLSSDTEGFSLVLVEAMECGLPCVSTDCPFGPSEIIEDGKTGLLSKMDVEDLAEKMEWMITREEERKAMGIAARQAAARYRKEIVMPQWEQAYLSVIK